MTPAKYGSRHKSLRKRYAPLVAAGAAICARCRKPIRPGEPWDLGHADGGGVGDYSGPEHRSCSRATVRHARQAVAARAAVASPGLLDYSAHPAPYRCPITARPWSRNWGGTGIPREDA